MPPAALSEGIKEREGKPAAAVDHAMATPDEPLSALSLFGRAGPERYRQDRADDAADHGSRRNSEEDRHQPDLGVVLSDDDHRVEDRCEITDDYTQDDAEDDPARLTHIAGSEGDSMMESNIFQFMCICPQTVPICERLPA
jgi:hypothetical protein